ncbi:MAG: hypothetical protein ACREQK_12135 [Candidatus Binatia bacterium]
MKSKISVLGLGILLSFLGGRAVAQEKVTVSHTTRGSLSIGPLLYGIERGFYRNEGIDFLYLSIRADLGIKALVAGEIDYIYSVGTVIRAAALGVPVKCLSFDFSKVTHFLMARPEIRSAAAHALRRAPIRCSAWCGPLCARAGLLEMNGKVLSPLRKRSSATRRM